MVNVLYLLVLFVVLIYENFKDARFSHWDGGVKLGSVGTLAQQMIFIKLTQLCCTALRVSVTQFYKS